MRKAIKEGDTEMAEGLIVRVEKMKVDFGVFYFGDTPKKLRAQLKSAQKSKQREAIERPSQKFKPELPEQQPTEKPATAQQSQGPGGPEVPTEVRNPDEEQPLRLPQTEGLAPLPLRPERVVASPDEEQNMVTRVPGPEREHPVDAPSNPEARRQSDAHLLAARRPWPTVTCGEPRLRLMRPAS